MRDPDHAPFLPALRFHRLTAFYDGIAMKVMRESAWKPRVVTAAAPGPGQRILDLGCGTGTLLIMLKSACPGAHVVGLDADPRVLGRARRKAARAGLGVELHEGRAQAPPATSAFEDASFDTCVSSLFFHHLRSAAKDAVLDQVHRLLRPGGRVLIADFGPPATLLGRAGFLATRLLDGFETTRDHAMGRLPAFMADAGFDDVRALASWSTPAGTLYLYAAHRP